MGVMEAILSNHVYSGTELICSGAQYSLSETRSLNPPWRFFRSSSVSTELLPSRQNVRSAQGLLPPPPSSLSYKPDAQDEGQQAQSLFYQSGESSFYNLNHFRASSGAPAGFSGVLLPPDLSHIKTRCLSAAVTADLSEPSSI